MGVHKLLLVFIPLSFTALSLAKAQNSQVNRIARPVHLIPRPVSRPSMISQIDSTTATNIVYQVPPQDVNSVTIDLPNRKPSQPLPNAQPSQWTVSVEPNQGAIASRGANINKHSFIRPLRPQPIGVKESQNGQLGSNINLENGGSIHINIQHPEYQPVQEQLPPSQTGITLTINHGQSLLPEEKTIDPSIAIQPPSATLEPLTLEPKPEDQAIVPMGQGELAKDYQPLTPPAVFGNSEGNQPITLEPIQTETSSVIEVTTDAAVSEISKPNNLPVAALHPSAFKLPRPHPLPTFVGTLKPAELPTTSLDISSNSKQSQIPNNSGVSRLPVRPIPQPATVGTWNIQSNLPTSTALPVQVALEPESVSISLTTNNVERPRLPIRPIPRPGTAGNFNIQSDLPSSTESPIQIPTKQHSESILPTEANTRIPIRPVPQPHLVGTISTVPTSTELPKPSEQWVGNSLRPQPLPGYGSHMLDPRPNYPAPSVHEQKPLPPIIENNYVQLLDYRCVESNGYYNIANECDTYVECKKNIALKYMCPDGLHFNPEALWPDYPCAYPSEVNCETRTIKQDPQPTTDCPRRYGFFALSDGDCSRYISCQEGLATIMNCPPGLVFNTVLSSCDWPENVPQCKLNVFQDFTCPAALIQDDGRPSDIIFNYRYGKNCKQYVACQRGHPRLLSCDPGLAFDETSGSCIDSEYVKNCSYEEIVLPIV